MSWASSMAKLERPPSYLDSPFSLSVWFTMAVEDRAKTSPIAKETDQICPKLRAMAITTMTTTQKDVSILLVNKKVSKILL